MDPDGSGNGREVLNLCANNYLGLAQHPDVRTAAHAALDAWGYGLASVRFICGTQGVHKQLEQKLSEFLGTEDTILYGSCFDANGGLFETLLGVPYPFEHYAQVAIPTFAHGGMENTATTFEKTSAILPDDPTSERIPAKITMATTTPAAALRITMRPRFGLSRRKLI